MLASPEWFELACKLLAEGARECGEDDFERGVLRERYRIERDKRPRPDGNEQYIEVTGQFAKYLAGATRRVSRWGPHRTAGAIHIGELQARSWIVAGTFDVGSTPARIASQVDQRQVGFCSTRA